MHEGSFHAFEALRASGRTVRRPDLTFAMPDHYVPTRARDRDPITHPELKDKVDTRAANARRERIAIFPVGDVRQGKLIELEIAGADADKARADIKAMCEKLLANTVIEKYEIELKP